jgi:hypothetical protein
MRQDTEAWMSTNLTGKPMTEPRRSQLRPKAHRENAYRVAERARLGAEGAGRTKYRDEFEPDHGPDLDEPWDGTETEREL